MGGERVILHEVRDADDETVVLADGFSCRSQISDLTDRRPLHLAQAPRPGPRPLRIVTARAVRTPGDRKTRC